MLEIKKAVRDNMAVLRLSGELDFHTSNDLRVALEEVVGNKFKALLVNLEKLSLIDSSGIGMLLMASKEMEKTGGKTILVAHSFVWELLSITRLEQFFERATDEDEAKTIATGIA